MVLRIDALVSAIWLGDLILGDIAVHPEPVAPQPGPRRPIAEGVFHRVAALARPHGKMGKMAVKMAGGDLMGGNLN